MKSTIYLNMLQTPHRLWLSTLVVRLLHPCRDDTTGRERLGAVPVRVAELVYQHGLDIVPHVAVFCNLVPWHFADVSLCAFRIASPHRPFPKALSAVEFLAIGLGAEFVEGFHRPPPPRGPRNCRQHGHSQCA